MNNEPKLEFAFEIKIKVEPGKGFEAGGTPKGLRRMIPITGGTFEGSINGGQEYSHEILIEGIPVGRSDLSGGNNNEFSPSAEAISEFKLQTGAVGAQYNGGQTAVANFNIKSGNAKPLYHVNIPGYGIGGPVMIPMWRWPSR